MSFENTAESIDPEIYARFREALEMGKWQDGRKLSKPQKEICLQAVMLYESKHEFDEDKKVGYVDAKKKTSPCDTKVSEDGDDDTSTIKILTN